MKNVVILGSSPMPGWNPFYKFIVDKRAFGLDAEIWAFNSFARTLPRVDVVFQVHLPGRYRNQPSWEWLKNTSATVYMREVDPEVKNSVEYPFEAVFEMTKHVRQGVDQLDPIKFLTSSAPFAIALAILQGRPKIHFYGFGLEQNTEYFEQRDCILFWMGFAAGKGLSLDIHCLDHIFKREIYYKPSSERLAAERALCHGITPKDTEDSRTLIATQSIRQ